MKTNLPTLALALLLAPTIAAADTPPFAYDASQTLCVIWNDATKTDLVEGFSTQVGNYKATDAELVTDGLTAGVRHGRVYAGVAAASVAPATDFCVGTIGPMYFSGTAVQTEAEYLMSRPTADAGSTTLGRALHNLRQFFGSSTTGVGSTPGLANAPSGSGSFEPIAPTSIADQRTWFFETNGATADTIITLKKPFTGTLAAAPKLNADADVQSFDAVTITGPEEVTASDLSLTANGQRLHFDTTTITVAGNYTVVMEFTTKDGQELTCEGKLVIR